MFTAASGLIVRLFPSLKRTLWRTWYQHLARRFGYGDWVFMNYGFAAVDRPAQPLSLLPEDEKDRYAIQLYDHALGNADLRGLDILEVGCGRGGGSSFMRRYRGPRSVTGVDFSPSNIAFCRRHHPLPGVRFLVGDAESLPFPENAFDAVVNIESSFCYGSMTRFLADVRRVLRPNGWFFFADLRRREDVTVLRRELTAAGLTWHLDSTITRNVLEALRLDSQRRRALIREWFPRPWQGVLRVFAGLPGTAVYESFRRGDREYMSAVLQKAPASA